MIFACIKRIYCIKKRITNYISIHYENKNQHHRKIRYLSFFLRNFGQFRLIMTNFIFIKMSIETAFIWMLVLRKSAENRGKFLHDQKFFYTVFCVNKHERSRNHESVLKVVWKSLRKIFPTKLLHHSTSVFLWISPVHGNDECVSRALYLKMNRRRSDEIASNFYRQTKNHMKYKWHAVITQLHLCRTNDAIISQIFCNLIVNCGIVWENDVFRCLRSGGCSCDATDCDAMMPMKNPIISCVCS